ncbi:MAG: CusA/CzcA family heavy metal efflux RND transporter [Verrucomicrobiae bacterium]|nr:CusA/CzcA family heavy metal efflux RND transporter [Verrucomicrobiae bacterium]
MINPIVQWCLRNRFLVITLYLGITGWGVWSMWHTPIDAIPDLSENQVIVFTEWPGRSAQEVEDQVTYPLSTAMQGLAGVKTVRASSAFGFSMLTIIFEDRIDVYFARARVLERLNSLPFKMPAGVVPMLGPDATGLGWVYQYYLDDSQARKMGRPQDLGQLRAIQDWLVRYQLNSVPGVAEVASIGGFVRQYQVDVDPNKLRAYRIPMAKISQAVANANRNVGGGVIEQGGREFTLRGLALIESPEDLRKLVVGTSGTQPIRLEEVATVTFGPEPRRGVLDKDGQEVVGGIIVMRYGESTRNVIQRVKNKIQEIQPALPAGVEIKPFYDRSELIERAIHTLRVTLIEEMILVTLAHILFLWHFRSILIVTIPLPLSILISFILMKQFGITSNIMSLSGIAIAIGVLVDAGIVMTEAVLREAQKVQQGGVPGLKYPEDLIQIVLRATTTVGRPIFFSMAIIILAFLPVFLLTGQSEKLFAPLAFTKSFAMVGATLLAITLVPVLCTLLIRGKLHDENDNVIMGLLLGIYLPVLKWALRFRGLVLGGAIVLFLAAVFLTTRMGSEFMPPLNERAILFMPTTLPSASITEVKRVMAAQDTVLSRFPEVESVVGKLGRAETATDPAPISMLETTIMLKPPEQWRKGMTLEKLREEMLSEMLKFPGFTPAFLQPIENRVLMLSTGVRTQVAVKIFGENLDQLQTLALEVEKVLTNIPGVADLYAERVTGSPYLEIDLRRDDVARFGVDVGEALEVIETALGGKTLTTTIEGRKRFPVRVRYARELRDSPEALRHILVNSMDGTSVPLEKIADLRLTSGPSMITSENGLLRVYVQCNVRGRDLGGFVEEAKKVVARELKLPPGYYIGWGGEYENQIQARQRLLLVVPIVIFIIFILLYITYHSFLEAAHVLLAVPFALTGGVFLQWALGYPFSVAVWVGYIALFGTAVQTGMIMVLYLEEAVHRKRLERGDAFNLDDLRTAVIEGAALRLRPKVMTVATILASLSLIMIPLFSGERTGMEIMRPIAVPVIGGMASSLLHILIVTPVIFLGLQEWRQRRKNRAG